MVLNAARFRANDPALGGLSALMGASILALAVTHPPMLPQFSVGADWSAPAATTIEYTSAWRPSGPPPVGDADQLSPEEVEVEGGPAAAPDRGRDAGASRARPER